MLRVTILICGLHGFAVSTATLTGQEPELSRTPPVALTELGEVVSEADNLKDNYFQYEARVEQLTEVASSLEGNEVGLLVDVERVTPYEVIVDIPKQGRTRMVLKHKQPPHFGNLGSRTYRGPPSTIRFSIFAKPVGLRIGDEVDIELAKQLRHGDRLRIAGRIEAMPIQIKPTFDPYVAAVISAWKIVGVVPAGIPDSGASSY